MAFTPIDLTGTYTNADGSVAAGFVFFTPTAEMYQPGAQVPEVPVAAQLNTSGELSQNGVVGVQLWANDDPSTLPTNQGYLVQEYIGNEPGLMEPTNSYIIILSYTEPGGTVDIGALQHFNEDINYAYAVAPSYGNATSINGIPVEGTPTLGQFLQYNGSAWVPVTLSGGGGGGGGGTDATELQGNPIAPGTPASAGYVLTWSGTQWAAAPATGGGGGGVVDSFSVQTLNGFAGTVTSGATPVVTLKTTVGTSGTPVILKGNGTGLVAAAAGSDFVAPNATPGGILAGAGSTYAAPVLSVTGVTADTYGDATHVGVFTVGDDGRISSASSVAITGGGGGSGYFAVANNFSELGTAPGNAGTARQNLHVPALAPAAAAISTPVTFSGSPLVPNLLIGGTVDTSYTIASGDVILLTGQTAQSQNGPWAILATSTGTYNLNARPSDFPDGAMTHSRSIVVLNGTVYGGSEWALNTSNAAPITIDTTAQVWEQIGESNATELQGTAISSSLAPVLGDALTWNGTEWTASAGGGLLVYGYPAPTNYSSYVGFDSRYPPANPQTGGSASFGTFVQNAMPMPMITNATWSSGSGGVATFTFAQPIVGTLGQIGDVFTAQTQDFTPSGYNIGRVGGGHDFPWGTFTVTATNKVTSPLATNPGASPATVFGTMYSEYWYGPGTQLIGEPGGAGPPAVFQEQALITQSINVQDTLGSTPFRFTQATVENAIVTDAGYTLSGSTATKTGLAADGICINQAVFIDAGSAVLQAGPPNTHVSNITWDGTTTTITFDQPVASGGSATLGFSPDVLGAPVTYEIQFVQAANTVQASSGQAPVFIAFAEFGTSNGGILTGASSIGMYSQDFYGSGVQGNMALGYLQEVAKAQGNAPGNGLLAHEVFGWFTGSEKSNYGFSTDVGYLPTPHAATTSYAIVSPAPDARPAGQPIAPVDVTSFGVVTSSLASSNLYTMGFLGQTESPAQGPYGFNSFPLTFNGSNGTTLSSIALTGLIITPGASALSWPQAGSGAIADTTGAWHVFSYQGALLFGNVVFQNVNFGGASGTVNNGAAIQPVAFVGKAAAVTYNNTIGRALTGVTDISSAVYGASAASYTLEAGNNLISGSNSQQLSTNFVVDPSRTGLISLTTGVSVTSNSGYVMSRQQIAYSTFWTTGSAVPVSTLAAAGTLQLTPAGLTGGGVPANPTGTAGFPGPRSSSNAYASVRQQLCSVVTTTGTFTMSYLWVNDAAATLEGCNWQAGATGNVAAGAAVYALYQPMDGQTITMINGAISQGVTNPPTITFVPANDLVLGDTSRVLGAGGTLSAVWKSDLQQWVETGYSAGSATQTSSSSSIWFNVMDYGAVGNGIHDDLPAFNAAKAAGIQQIITSQSSSRGGFVIYAPGGYNYGLSGPFVADVPMTLMGDNGASPSSGGLATAGTVIAPLSTWTNTLTAPYNYHSLTQDSIVYISDTPVITLTPSATSTVSATNLATLTVSSTAGLVVGQAVSWTVSSVAEEGMVASITDGTHVVVYLFNGATAPPSIVYTFGGNTNDVYVRNLWFSGLNLPLSGTYDYVNAVTGYGGNGSCMFINVGVANLTGSGWYGAGLSATSTAGQDGWHWTSCLADNIGGHGYAGNFVDASWVDTHGQGCGRQQGGGTVGPRTADAFNIIGGNNRFIACRGDLSRWAFVFNYGPTSGYSSSNTLIGCGSQRNNNGAVYAQNSSTGNAAWREPIIMDGCSWEGDGVNSATWTGSPLDGQGGVGGSGINAYGSAILVEGQQIVTMNNTNVMTYTYDMGHGGAVSCPSDCVGITAAAGIAPAATVSINGGLLQHDSAGSAIPSASRAAAASLYISPSTLTSSGYEALSPTALVSINGLGEDRQDASTAGWGGTANTNLPLPANVTTTVLTSANLDPGRWLIIGAITLEVTTTGGTVGGTLIAGTIGETGTALLSSNSNPMGFKWQIPSSTASGDGLTQTWSGMLDIEVGGTITLSVNNPSGGPTNLVAVAQAASSTAWVTYLHAYKLWA